MKALKIFNSINGVFYTVYGFWGALMPMGMAGVMGWTPNLLGLHQIRAVSMVMGLIGLYILWGAIKLEQQRLLVLMIIGATLAFAAGRFLGLIFDGAGPLSLVGQTYGEIGFELFWSLLGYILYRRT